MNWPTISDYKDALQTPARCFIRPDLMTAIVERNKLGPRGRSGNYAIVYKLDRCDNTSVAVKLFKNPDTERERRYQAISDQLAITPSPFTVGFEFSTHGIYAAQDWFPILGMDWVSGDSLGVWTDARAAAGDSAALRALADEWVKLMEFLISKRIAHGDLQHSNILVSQGKLVLVDYDGMYTPTLDAYLTDEERLTGPAQLEFGLDAYQHPRRRERPLGPDLDHFSAWIILISLRALAADKGLYRKYKVRPGTSGPHENLLFIEADLRGPSAPRAEIWGELARSPDPEVRGWSAALRACLLEPFEKIPPFRIDAAGPIIAELIKACTSVPRNWPRIHELRRSLPYGSAIPAEVKLRVAEAKNREEARLALQAALDTDDSKAVRRAYVPKLIDDRADCSSLVGTARKKIRLADALDELEAAARSPENSWALIALFEKNAPLLNGSAAADKFRKLAEECKLKIEAEDRSAAISSGDQEKESIATTGQTAPIIIEPRPERKRVESERKWWMLPELAVGIVVFALFALLVPGAFEMPPPPVPNMAIIEISKIPPAAELYIDGDRVGWDGGTQSAELRVKPGSHKLEVKQVDKLIYETSVCIERGSRKTLEVPSTPAAIEDSIIPSNLPSP